MIKEEKRYPFIDVARGIAILLVILGHSCSPSKILLNQIILSYHMPLFLFLSGMLSRNIDRDNVLSGIVKKAKRLLIPQCTMATLTSLYTVCCISLNGGGKNVGICDILSNYLFWFLPVLLLCFFIQTAVSLGVNSFFRTNCVCLLTGAILVIPSLYLIDISEVSDTNILIKFLVRILCITPTALCFYSMGALMKNLVLNKVGNDIHTRKSGLINILLICTIIVLSSCNGFVFMYINDYGINYLFFFTCSLIGIYMTLKISTLLEKSILLQIVGKYSICLYVWNFAACYFAKNIGNVISHFIELQPTAKSVLNFGIALVFILFWTKITKVKFSYLYGLK